MDYKIINAMPAGEFEGKFGKTLKYTLMLEGEQTSVELNQKPTTPAPKAGDTISGTIEDGQYGRKFKKETQSNGFSGGTKSDPAIQKAIIRQNALTNAVNYCVAKAQLDKNYKLEGKEVIQVATYFAKYSMGDVTVVNDKPKSTVVTGDKDDFIAGLEEDNKQFNDEGSVEELSATLDQIGL